MTVLHVAFARPYGTVLATQKRRPRR